MTGRNFEKIHRYEFEEQGLLAPKKLLWNIHFFLSPISFLSASSSSCIPISEHISTVPFPKFFKIFSRIPESTRHSILHPSEEKVCGCKKRKEKIKGKVKCEREGRGREVWM